MEHGRKSETLNRYDALVDANPSAVRASETKVAEVLVVEQLLVVAILGREHQLRKVLVLNQLNLRIKLRERMNFSSGRGKLASRRSSVTETALFELKKSPRIFKTRSPSLKSLEASLENFSSFSSLPSPILAKLLTRTLKFSLLALTLIISTYTPTFPESSDNG